MDYKLSALEDVAALTRKMPDEFITASGTDVTDAFRHYLRPLLGTGMPEVHRLRNVAVPKHFRADGSRCLRTGNRYENGRFLGYWGLTVLSLPLCV